MEQTGLRSGVEFRFQRVVVLPRDPHAAGLTDDAANAESLALEPCVVIFIKIPAVGDAAR
jgi:hypothetical protein